MPNPSDFFWTDLDQAYQRLNGTVVCYEGKPVFVASVERHSDGIPRGQLMALGSTFRHGTPVRKMLNSPGFARFRELPKLGWVNLVTSLGQVGPPPAVFLKRRPVNGTQHGLCSRNVSVVDAHNRPSEVDFTGVIGDDGFLMSQSDDYPEVGFALENIGRGMTIGVALSYAISCDLSLGLRYLIRNDERIGLIVGNEIRLPEHMLFLADEIRDTRAFQGRVVIKL